MKKEMKKEMFLTKTNKPYNYYNLFPKGHFFNGINLSYLAEYSILLGIPKYTEYTTIDNIWKPISLKDFYNEEKGRKERVNYNIEGLGRNIILSLIDLILKDVILNNTEVVTPTGGTFYIGEQSLDFVDYKRERDNYTLWSPILSEYKFYCVRYKYLSKGKKKRREVHVDYNTWKNNIVEKSNNGEVFAILHKKTFKDYLGPMLKLYPYVEPMRLRMFIKNSLIVIHKLATSRNDILFSKKIEGCINSTIYTNIPGLGKAHAVSKKKMIIKNYILNDTPHKYRIRDVDIRLIKTYDKLFFNTDFFINNKKLEHHNKIRVNMNLMKNNEVIKEIIKTVEDIGLIDKYPYLKNYDTLRKNIK